MSANSKAQKGQDDYEVANAAWKKYRGASDEILQLSREGKQQEASKLMTGEVYEDYKSSAGLRLARIKRASNFLSMAILKSITNTKTVKIKEG